MTENRFRPTPTSWTFPKFRFHVKVDGITMAFSEMTGLSTDSQPIEYRRADRPSFAPMKLSGLSPSGTVTLKKGVFAADAALLGWLRQGAAGADRKTVTVTLIDEAGNPTMVWTLKGAFPAKVTASDLQAAGNDVPIETIELGYEGLSVGNA